MLVRCPNMPTRCRYGGLTATTDKELLIGFDTAERSKAGFPVRILRFFADGLSNGSGVRRYVHVRRFAVVEKHLRQYAFYKARRFPAEQRKIF